MGRWLLLILIAANLLYGAWYWLQPPAPGQPVAAPLQDQEGVPRLTTLAERGPVPDTGDVGESVTAALEPETPAAQTCGRLGPFAEQVSARQVQNRLADLDIAARVDSEEVVVREDYWVHIPPRDSEAAALAMLRELQKRDIDSFLITDGDLVKGISLGFFSRRESAQKVRDKRREQGYPAEIREVPRTERKFWLLISSPGVAALDASRLDELARGGLDATLQQVPCADVAPAEDFD